MKTGFERVDQCDPRQCIASKVMKMHRIINGIFRKHLKPFGLTNSQMSILFVLSKNEGMSQQALADFLYLEKSSLKRNVDGLVRKELISKAYFPQIHISKDGLQLLEQVIPVWEKAMAETRQRLGDEGEMALNTTLNALIH